MKHKDKKLLRILHSHTNICGFPAFIAEKEREQGHVSDVVTYHTHPFFKEGVFCLRTEESSIFGKITLRVLFFLIAISKYDVFHFTYGQTLLPFNLDLPILRLFRKKILMTFCGSDIRLMGRVEHLRNPYLQKAAQDNPQDKPKYDNKKIIKMKWLNLWIKKFITCRNGIANVAHAIPSKKIITDIWIHNINANLSHLPAFTKKPNVLTIVHAPSHKGVKGTSYVRQAIKQLHSQNYQFKYIEVTNKTNEECIKIYQQADIIIDQLLLGGFGSLAVEGMSLGCVVVGYILDDIEKMIPDCPVWNATIDNLSERLIPLLENKDLRSEVSKKGVEFVKKHFDSKTMISKLEKIYRSL